MNFYFKKKIYFIYALHMQKAQRGQKLSKVRKVVTLLNFVTPPSFSVTPPSCKPVQSLAQLSKEISNCTYYCIKCRTGLVLPHPLPHPLFRLPFARFVNAHPFETLILIVWKIIRPLDSFFVIRGLANGKCNIRLGQRSGNR